MRDSITRPIKLILQIIFDHWWPLRLNRRLPLLLILLKKQLIWLLLLWKLRNLTLRLFNRLYSLLPLFILLLGLLLFLGLNLFDSWGFLLLLNIFFQYIRVTPFAQYRYYIIPGLLILITRPFRITSRALFPWNYLFAPLHIIRRRWIIGIFNALLLIAQLWLW